MMRDDDDENADRVVAVVVELNSSINRKNMWRLLRLWAVNKSTHTRTRSPEANPTNALSCWWLWHRYANYNCTIVLRPAAPSERLAKVKSSSKQPLLMASSQMRQCCQCDVSMCILNTYYVSAAYRKPNLTGATISFDVHEASQLLEFSTFLRKHTHTHMISQHQKRKHCAILCLFAGQIEAYYAATHASSSPRIVCHERAATHSRHTYKDTHTHTLTLVNTLCSSVWL